MCPAVTADDTLTQQQTDTAICTERFCAYTTSNYFVLYRDKLEREEVARQMVAKKRAEVFNKNAKNCDVNPTQLKNVCIYVCVYVCM